MYINALVFMYKQKVDFVSHTKCENRLCTMLEKKNRSDSIRNVGVKMVCTILSVSVRQPITAL